MATRTSAPLKGAAIVFGLLLGVQDVRAAKAELDRAVASRDARRVGERLYIADPLFVVKAWRDRWAACLTSAWCYVPSPTPSAPPPAPSRDPATSRPSPAVQACYDSSERAIAEAFAGRQPLGMVAQAQRECDRRRGEIAPLTDRLLTLPPAESAQRVPASAPRHWWSTLWPVVVARWAVFPLVQTGWALISLG